MSGKFLTNSMLLRGTDCVIDVVNCDSKSALVTEQCCVKQIDIFYQKQIRSWSTNSWDIFTCGAVKIPSNNDIYAVTNNCIVWKWDFMEESLDNVKKVTFKTEIHKLLMIKDELYIHFKTGFLQPLSNAIKSKKETKKLIVEVEESILQVKIISDNKYAILAKNKDNSKRRMYIVDIETCSIIPELTVDINCDKVCQCHIINMQLITLYSNGEIYSKNILQQSISFPGPMKGRISLINCSKDVNIMEVGDHAVFQGRAADDEGDYLILWNYKYYLPVDEKRIKMSLDTRMGWSLNEGLALMEGHTLGHVHLELKPTTARLMFGIGVKDEQKEYIQSLRPSDSSSDYTSVQSITEVIARNDLKGILNWFKKSPCISEKIFIIVLKYTLELPEENFNKISKSKLHLQYSEQILNGQMLPYNIMKFNFISFLLNTKYTSSELLKEMWKLLLDNAETLFLHIIVIINLKKNLTLTQQSNINNTCDLLIVLVRANYAKIMASYAPCTQEVLKRLLSSLGEELEMISNMHDLYAKIESKRMNGNYITRNQISDSVCAF